MFCWTHKQNRLKSIFYSLFEELRKEKELKEKNLTEKEKKDIERFSENFLFSAALVKDPKIRSILGSFLLFQIEYYIDNPKELDLSVALELLKIIRFLKEYNEIFKSLRILLYLDFKKQHQAVNIGQARDEKFYEKFKEVIKELVKVDMDYINGKDLDSPVGTTGFFLVPVSAPVVVVGGELLPTNTMG